MNSQVTDSFLACFAKLPEHVKTQARKCYRLWRDDPSHPSLKFKKVQGRNALYSVRVGIDWRALGLLQDNTMTWFWIGLHAEYDKLIP